MPYHFATLQMLAQTPQLSTVAHFRLAATEQRLGCDLPASVREWYALDAATEILLEHSNADPPIAMDDWVIVNWKDWRLLPLRTENQGVCTWAVLLDGTDDPPVVVEVDSNGQEWQPHAATFSSYVHACVWDHRRVLGRPALVQAQNEPLTETALRALTLRFPSVSQTRGWPGQIQWRFESAASGLLIWADAHQADWFIGADDAGALESILAEVWSLDSVGLALYEGSPVGASVLEQVRSLTPRSP